MAYLEAFGIFLLDMIKVVWRTTSMFCWIWKIHFLNFSSIMTSFVKMEIVFEFSILQSFFLLPSFKIEGL